jgi:copper transport protein
LLFAAVLAGTPLCQVPDANAHASLIEAAPADGAVLDQVPRFVRLRFNEPISPIMIKLIGSDGHARDDITFKAANEAIEVALPSDLRKGTNILSYRVISADGHPVGGTLLFSIGHLTQARETGVDAGDHLLPPLIWLTKVALYIALFIGVGGAFFRAWIAPERSWCATSSVVAGVALAVGLIAAPVSLGLQGLDVLAAPHSRLAVRDTWIAGFETSVGGSAIIAIIAMLFAALAIYINRIEVQRALSSTALAGVGLSLAATGHASMASPQIVMRPAVFIHTVGVAYWLGALIPLALMLSRGARPETLPAFQRFSVVAVPVVASLVVAGAVLAVVQIERPSALIDSRYGQIFLAKMLAVLVLLALAAINRLFLLPSFAAGKLGTEAKLRRSISLEIGVTLVILALVAAWRFTPPPRALATVAAQTTSIHIHTAEAMVNLSLTPDRVGATSLNMVFLTGDFAPLNPKEVTVMLSKPDRGVEAIIRKAERASDGAWRVDKLVLPMAGNWNVRVNVLVTDFQKIILEDQIAVRP